MTSRPLPRPLRRASASGDAAVSEVLATTLLVALSVVVLGGFGAVVLATVATEGVEPPSGSFSMAPVAGEDHVDVAFVSGSRLDLAGIDLVLLVNDATRLSSSPPPEVLDAGAAGAWTPGERLRVNVTAPALAHGDRVFLMVVDKASGVAVGSARATLGGAVASSTYVMNAPTIDAVSVSPSPLVADGQRTANLTVTISSSRGLALVRSVSVNLSPVGGPTSVALRDDGEAPDLVAGDGTYAGSFSVSNHTFLSSPGQAYPTVRVTVTDVLGHVATHDETLSLTTPLQSKVATGARYRDILPSSLLGYLNLSSVTFRDADKLGNDQIQVRVSDLADASLAWSAVVSFNASSTCGAGPGVTRIEIFRDGRAGSGVWTPDGAACLLLGSAAQVNLANVTASLDASGAVIDWAYSGGGADYNYTAAGIGERNELAVTFFGDTLSISPLETGLGQTDVVWGAIGGNRAPSAYFIITLAPNTPPHMDAAVNGEWSSDPEGEAVTFDWDWGDGTAHGTGETDAHTYATAGNYTITLTVADPDGATGTYQRATVANRPPAITGGIANTTTGLQVDVGATTSEPDGQQVSHVWVWGDGSVTNSHATPSASHTYATGGAYTVRLYVNDTLGGSATTTTQVRPNRAPTASFTNSTTGLQLDVDGTGSSDPDGQALTYEWSWGDGTANGAGATASHTYLLTGTYLVNLTVTDAFGASATTQQSVTVSPLVGPTASFTYAVTGLTVDANASGSSGTGLTYSWDWGNGDVTNGGLVATASHTYAAAGNHTVTLTVTDASLATDSDAQVVTANRAPVVASFTTQAVSTDAWANATASDPDGHAIDYTIAWGDGTTSTAANLSSVSLTHAYASGGTYTVTLWVNDSHGGSTMATSTLIVAANQAPSISSFTAATSALTAWANATASDPDGDAIGYVVAWGDGATSSAGDGASASLSHAYATGGNYTVTLYVNDTRGGSAVRAAVVTVTAPPVVSAFTTSTSGLTAFVNASASAPDAGETIAYTVAWGDGTTTSFGDLASISAQRAYAAAGNYTVTLYVNDSLGGSTQRTSVVTVNRAPTISSFATASSGLTGFANTSAADPDGHAISYTVAWGDGTTSTSGNAATSSLSRTYASAGTYTVTVYVNDTLGGSAVRTGTITASAPGTAPSAPRSLVASPANNQVGLNWTWPADNGTSALTGYKVYRGTSSGSHTLLATTGTNLTFTDKTAVNGVTYHYVVRAYGSAGESASSNEVTATPSSAVSLDCASMSTTSGSLSSCSSIQYADLVYGTLDESGGGSAKSVSMTFSMNLTGVTGTQTLQLNGYNSKNGEDLILQAQAPNGTFMTIATLPGTTTGAATASGTVDAATYWPSGRLTLRLIDLGPDPASTTWQVDYVRMVTT